MFGYIDVSSEPPPTMREKRWVKVGWPSTAASSHEEQRAGLWVSEFDTTFSGVDEEENLLPNDEGAGRLTLARTMDERCAMLRDRFRGRFYENIKEYAADYTF